MAAKETSSSQLNVNAAKKQEKTEMCMYEIAQNDEVFLELDSPQDPAYREIIIFW